MAVELPELPERYNRPGVPRPSRGAPRVAALDGLRGVAITGVVAFHAGVLPGGFLGVDLFFVLSGFLITGLLLDELNRTGSVALKEFWTRRARRLVPAVIVLVAIAQMWTRTRALPSELQVLNGQSVAAMLYAGNWYNVLFDVGYWSVGTSHSPLNHLWSLAIEEQFYLLFPILFAGWFAKGGAGSARRAGWFAVVCIMLAGASFALMALLFQLQGANRAYFGTDARIGAILTGVALAALFQVRRMNGDARRGISRNTMLNVSTIISVAGVFALWFMADVAAPWMYRGGFAAHAVASVVLITGVSLPGESVLHRLLSWRPLVWLGERSYSLYLWHWPLMVALTPGIVGVEGAAYVAIMAAVIAIATLVSYEIVEHPIRYSHLRGLRLVATLTVPALFISASALFWQPPSAPQFGNQVLVTQGRDGIRLMLVGDSWARNLGVALASVDSTHRITILNLGKGGCGIADSMRERSEGRGTFDTPPDCKTWRSAWTSTIDSVNPEVAILNVGNWDQALQDFDGTGEFVGACHPQFAERYSRQLDKAIGILGSRKARVFVMTIRDNNARDGSGPDCMNQLLRASVERHASSGVTLLDQYAQLCSQHVCPATVDGERVYDETGHLMPEPQRRIAVWVLNSVNAAITSPN